MRSFTFGHVRRLDCAFETILARAWAAGVGPGSEPLTIDLDSTIVEVAGHGKQGAGFGYTKRRGYHPILATRAETGEVLHARMRKGSAQSQRGAERFVRELVQRVRRLGAAGPLLVRADSGFWSNKTIAALEQHDVRYSIGVTQQVEADHRRHAQIELAIRDLEQSSGLNHAPSGHFFANAAWLLVSSRAHNLARWIAHLGLQISSPIVAQTIRRRYLTLPGPITRSARRATLHLPARRPWRESFRQALARLRAIPLLT